MALGWVDEVFSDPQAFAATVDAARPGWIALHKHDYGGAAEAPANEVLVARAALALGLLHEDLAALSGDVGLRFYTGWKARGSLPEGPDAPLAAALAAACAGGDAKIWADQVTEGEDAVVAVRLQQGDVFGPATATGGPVALRLQLHAAARTTGDPTPLMAVASTPLITRQAEGFSRHYWDLCLHRTLADLWLAKGLGAAPQDEAWRNLPLLTAKDAPLSTRLFAPWATTADLRASLASAPALGQVGTPVLTPTEDPDAAAEAVRHLDDALATVTEAMDAANTDGTGIVTELRLVHRIRQEWLLVAARKALRDNHPRTALRLLELAQDHARSEVGPGNAPALFALLAQARLRLGRTREALDAIHVLARALPEVRGLLETASDLAVLEGIDRTGDSKEAQ